MSELNDRPFSYQFRSGPESRIASFKTVAVSYEPVWVTDSKQLYIADGADPSTLTPVAGGVFTVGTLPTAGVVGRRAIVTDANSPTFGATVVSSGAVVITVFDNGTAWKVG